jgi:2-oxoglutarate dehydrogenase E2 component (dihydrolipoamide succinyltransferase)
LSAVQCYGLNSTVSVSVEVDNVLNFVNFNMPLLKGSFLPIIVYETSRLLKKYPKMNSFFEDDSIVYYDVVNIGIAMDMEKGLKVLKMSNSDQLSIMEIEKSILDLSRKYYEDKITVKDVSDVTFTVTDLSGSGVATFFPLINKNNSAILAVSSVDEKLKRLNLTVTFDHRVTEGKYAAAFLYELKTRIESYTQEATFEGISMDAGSMCFKCHRKVKDEKNTGVVFLKILGSAENNNIICSVCYDGWYEGL